MTVAFCVHHLVDSDVNLPCILQIENAAGNIFGVIYKRLTSLSKSKLLDLHRKAWPPNP